MANGLFDIDACVETFINGNITDARRWFDQIAAHNGERFSTVWLMNFLNAHYCHLDDCEKSRIVAGITQYKDGR